MISKVLFAEKFSVLCDQLGKRLAQPTIAEWYAVLNASLNDQQFSTECDRLFRGAQKMPTPNEFIQGAKAANPGSPPIPQVTAFVDLPPSARAEYLEKIRRGREIGQGTLERLETLAARNRQLRERIETEQVLSWAKTQDWVEVQYQGDRPVALRMRQGAKHGN